MALILKQKIATSGTNDTFDTGANGSRLYSVVYGVSDNGSRLEISDDSGATYALIDTGLGTLGENHVRPANMPSVLQEDGGGQYFYPLGTGIKVKLTSSSASVSVLYVDL